MPPQRQLGLLSATALVVASMVGSGVFTTSGILLADLHSPSLVLAAWLAGGVIAVMGALCYGALARRYPESGGEYIFLARTLHPAAGYLVPATIPGQGPRPISLHQKRQITIATKIPGEKLKSA